MMNNSTIAKNASGQYSTDLSAHQQNLPASETKVAQFLKYRGKTYLASDLKYEAKFSTSLLTKKYRGVDYSSCIINLTPPPCSDRAKSSLLPGTYKYRGVEYTAGTSI